MKLYSLYSGCRNGLVFALLFFAMCACSDEYNVPGPVSPEISFVAGDPVWSGADYKEPSTKAARVYELGTAPYNAFRVQTHVMRNGSLLDKFFINEDAMRSGNGWATGNDYYWPGEQYNLSFVAWSPCMDGVFESVPQNPQDKDLEYTVPDDASDQYDLLAAYTGEMAGNYNRAVNLEFRHICTAVRFTAGGQLPNERPKSVTIKGVYGSGSYDMVSAAWNINEADAVRDFSQMFSEGAELTPEESIFMMIPQRLPEGATLEVVFTNSVTGADRTLSVSIAGNEWPIGKAVTYNIAVYDLNFVSEPEIQDAHYVICPIKFRAGVLENGWTFESENPAVTLRTSLTDLQKRGYWIEEDRGTLSVSGTVSGEEITVYAFLEENISDTIRELPLKLYPTGVPSVKRTFRLRQYCPSWEDGNSIGYERIEESGNTGYPFGFAWKRNVPFTFTGTGGWFATRIEALLKYLNVRGYENGDYIKVGWSVASPTVTINIDYSKLNSLLVQNSESDGLQNTRGMLTGLLLDMTDLEDKLLADPSWIKGEVDEAIPNAYRFAARIAAMKNKFGKETVTETQDGQTVTYEKPVIVQDNIVWYLPASAEQANITDNMFPLEGVYWSSTSRNDENAASYSMPGGTVSSVGRMTPYKIRAARRKP